MAGTSRRTKQALAVAAAGLLGMTALAALDHSAAYAASTATISGSTVLQPIDGFGFSEAFGRTSVIRGLSAQNQRQVLDLLFSPTTGAGMSVLRNGISSTSSSIEPTNPGGPNATPNYVWDGDDDGQVWLSQQAQSYGVSRFYANAWSAPGFMKTNGNEANGGTLCGLQGASCASGDWRRAYANYLLQYARFYAQEGITITDIGFTNEPDFTASYSSMRFTPAQAAEFAAFFGPMAASAGLRLTCCDSFGWSQQRSYTQAVEGNANARAAVQTHTGHTYASQVDGALPTSRHVWMSEWNPNGSSWNENWDDGSGYDGFTVANAIHTALTTGNVNAYIYWYGVSTSTTRGFIQADGSNYHVSKRLWAMAAYSRYIRPGANRIGATTSDGNLRLSAFRNSDGSVVVVALNAAGSATDVSYALQNTGVTTGTATPYLTNGSNSMAAQPAIGISGGTFTATVPARSLVTYLVRAGGTQSASPSVSASVSPSSASPSVSPSSASPSPTQGGGSSCRVTYTPNAWNTGLTANITITNTGGSAVNGWSLVFTLPAGQTIVSGWNASYTPASGEVTARNLSYNASIPPGGSTTIGFQASHTGNTGSPASFTLNGTACAVG